LHCSALKDAQSSHSLGKVFFSAADGTPRPHLTSQLTFTTKINSHTYLVLSPSAASAAAGGMVVFQKMKVTNSQEAQVQIVVNANDWPTESTWLKSVRANDTDVNLNHIPQSFTSLIIDPDMLRFQTALWSFQSAKTLNWELTATMIDVKSVYFDKAQTFTVDRSVNAAIFKLDGVPYPADQVYFQILPSVDPESRDAYRSPDILARSVSMNLTTMYGNIMSHYPDAENPLIWGLTNELDGPAIEISIPDWDSQAVWIQVFMAEGAPSNKFTILVFRRGNAFDTCLNPGPHPHRLFLLISVCVMRRAKPR
jgi:hypothetical protein